MICQFKCFVYYCTGTFVWWFERIRVQDSPTLVIQCSRTFVDVNVGEGRIGNDHNDGFRSKSMNELDVERELNEEEGMQVEVDTQQQ